jgi:tetratricopeptide (TPR) repeat protein
MWRHATAPTSYDAYLLSRDAGARFMRGDHRGALAQDLRANQLDTAFSLALVGAVMASVNLDEWARADSLIGVLDRRRALLTPGEHRTLAWLQARLRGDRLAAYALARGAGDLFPGTVADIQEGLEAVVVNRPADAIRVLARIDPERADVRGWAPYWRRLTEAHHLTGDHASELAVARRAHRSLGAERLWTLEVEARALAALGRTGELAALLDRALAMPAEGGLTPGGVLVTAAAELRAHGRAGEAGPVLGRALAWFDAHPAARRERAPGLRAHAEALLMAGRPADARRILLASPADSAGSWYRGLLGVAAARTADAAAARRAAAAMAGDPRPYLFGRTLYWAGAVRGALGDSAAAVAALREAFARGQPYGAYLHVAPEWDAVRGYAPYEQLIRPAR